jgi:histone-arginine methyltransferase CARM1
MAGPASEPHEEKDKAYFGYYGMLAHQQNMLQDLARTSAYNQAILTNPTDFKDKVVMDVGCGSGILSFFAAQAGAKKVYAIEAATSMAKFAKQLVKANGLEHVITVISGKVEDIQISEQVDIIISEPMGVLLVHERMLESFLVARDKWLKPKLQNGSGKLFAPSQMFPSTSTIFFSPFNDPSLYASIHEKIMFWSTSNFYGVDLTSLGPSAIEQYFGQPIVGGVEPKSLMAASSPFDIRFTEVSGPESLHSFTVPICFTIEATGICHGLAAWFNVDFLGSTKTVVLSTGPLCPRTHWHQARLVFRNPIALNRGQKLSGEAHFTVNTERSYDIEIEIEVDQSAVSLRQKFFLNDQQYWNLAQQPSIPDDFNLDYLSLYPNAL